MKPNSHEQSKRHTFDSFCKKVLKHEARDYYDELKRQRDREVSFSDLSEKELAQLYTEDKYFVSEQIFNVLGLNVIVTDDVIAEALQSLPERKHTAVSAVVVTVPAVLRLAVFAVICHGVHPPENGYKKSASVQPL